jgi:hypothetical protein
VIQFETEWGFGDLVNIDNDTSIRATITEIGFKRGGACELYLEWFSNGAPQSAWFPEWRVTRAE